MKSRRIVFGLTVLAVFVVVAISMGTFGSQSKEQGRQSVANAHFRRSQQRALIVEVISQPGCSLRISKAKDYTVDPKSPEVSYELENVGTKPIVAYTIHNSLNCGNSTTDGFEINNILSRAKMIHPGESVERVLSGFGCSQAVDRVRLSIDFIEFRGSKTWGEDVYKSRQRLAGMRAGARNENIATKRIINAEGSVEIFNARQESNWIIPRNRTEQWVAGYRIGRNFRRNQIEKAFSEFGVQGIKDTLAQPYDASGKEEK